MNMSNNSFTDVKRFFLMIPPVEIIGKKQLIIAKRGHFEISHNLIQYNLSDKTTDFFRIYPQDGYCEVNEIPPLGDMNTNELLTQLLKDLTDLCFIKNQEKNIFLRFFTGNILPFSMDGLESGFYELKPLSDDIFEEFYRMTTTLEDTITTTVSTFDTNVFIPFKQKFVSKVHNRENQDSKEVLSTLSRDFPKFFGLHRDLLTVMRTQAKQVSDNQQLSFRLFSPILRKIQMLTKLSEFIEIKKSWGRNIIKVRPLTLNSEQIANKLLPIVEPK